MVLKRNLFGWRFEEYWFDEPGYLSSRADIAALRTHGIAGRDVPSHCRIPEKTLVVPLERSEEEILAGFATRARTSIRQAQKTVEVRLAAAPEERRLFYEAYLPFAAGKGLLVPNPDEEEELEIFLARNREGELLQAAAFLPAPREKIYRYRYGVYVRKSQANAILIQAAMGRARNLGAAFFDLGGVTPGARPGSPEAGINFFKSQFGGVEMPCLLHLRGARPAPCALLSLLQATGLAAR
ncbi:MAG TPA: hypothetical protein VJ385_18640, partial [Fibrobacteria bacterium]|nr:hypothetical protein [Fibrobacteria bacterium]